MKLDDDFLIKLVFGLSLLLVWLVASDMDYQDALAEEQHYIQEVCNNYIPNYKNWDIDCVTKELK